MRVCLAVLCLVAATACDDGIPSGPAVPLNERFTLQRGHAAPIGSTGERILFLDVTGDSRCPADAVCIQGGDAIVRVQIEGNGSSTYELHTGDASRASARHRDLTIELLELQPYPFSSRAIDPSDYVATLVVRR